MEMAMEIDVIRIESGRDCIRGALLVEGVLLGTTLELPWRNNERDVSCVPFGSYKAVPHYSERHGDTLRLLDVPGRDGIIFHSGNTAGDSRGCILLGTSYGVLEGRPAVMASRRMVETFRRIITEGGLYEIRTAPYSRVNIYDRTKG